MKIPKINFSSLTAAAGKYTTNVQGMKTSKLFEPIEGLTIGKNLRPIDINCFRSYAATIPLRMGITAPEAAELKKLDGIDFVSAAYNFLLKKLGIKQEIAPGVLSENLPPQIEMAYKPATNLLFLKNGVNTITDKVRTFGLLRHEMQHYIQNMNILRHEKYGKAAVDEYVKAAAEEQKIMIEQIVKLPDEEILKLQNVNHEALLKFKKLYNENNTDGVQKMYSSLEENIRKEWIALRDNVVKKMGLIKEDSALTPQIKRYYEEFKNIGYYKQDGQIDYNNYFASLTEQEAIASQIASIGEISGKCPLAAIREAVVADIKNYPEAVNEFIA